MISFGENIHRRALPYGDTIQICDELFKKYAGSKVEKIKQIAQDLGISTTTVTKYLSYRLVPKKVQDMVSEGRISADKAHKITETFWPNEDKIIRMATYVAEMTPSEWERVLDVGKKKPEVPLEELVEEVQKPPLYIEITIRIEVDNFNLLQRVAKQRGKKPEDLINDAITDFVTTLEEEEKA